MQSIEAPLFQGKSVSYDRPVNAGRARPVAVFCSDTLTIGSHDQYAKKTAICIDRKPGFAFLNLKNPRRSDHSDPDTLRENNSSDIFALTSVAEPVDRHSGAQIMLTKY